MMLSSIMSNSTSLSEEASVSSVTRVQDFSSLNLMFSPSISPQPQQQQQQLKNKKKRSLPGNPDPEAEVIALSPKSLMTTNRFICEICNKGFQRDQNLQLHRRGHNLPWKLRQRSSTEIRKRVYVCPEVTCVHHSPARALGDLTGIKKHFCRKHGEKKWKCEKCSKKYAVQSDWKAHTKTCGTKEYRCDCGTLFSRKDSFITHRAFCDALAEETAKLYSPQRTTQSEHPVYLHPQNPASTSFSFPHTSPQSSVPISTWDPLQNLERTSNSILTKSELNHQHNPDFTSNQPPFYQYPQHRSFLNTPSFLQQRPHTTSDIRSVASPLSATALLQKAVNVGVAAMSNATQAQSVGHMTSSMTQIPMRTKISPGCLKPNSGHFATWQKSDSLTRDFLGLTGDCGGTGNAAGNVRDILSYTQTTDFPSYGGDRSILKPPHFGFADPDSRTWGDC